MLTVQYESYFSIFANIHSIYDPICYTSFVPISSLPYSTRTRTWTLVCRRQLFVAPASHLWLDESNLSQDREVSLSSEESHRQGGIRLLSLHIVPKLNPWIHSCSCDGNTVDGRCALALTNVAEKWQNQLSQFRSEAMDTSTRWIYSDPVRWWHINIFFGDNHDRLHKTD